MSFSAWESSFDRFSGNNEYQRQSWRDNFNGGRAAGDWSGGVNARIDSERDRFQGTTESGSSLLPSGLQLAQMIGAGKAYVSEVGSIYLGGSGPGRASVSTGGGGTGPGSAGVVSGKPGDVAAQPGGQGPEKTTEIWIGGHKMHLDTKWSDGADGEDRWGDVGGSIYGLGVMINDGWSVGAQFVKEQTKQGLETLKERKESPRETRLDLWGAVTGTAGQFWNDLTGAQNNWNPNGNRGSTGTGTLTGGGF